MNKFKRILKKINLLLFFVVIVFSSSSAIAAEVNILNIESWNIDSTSMKEVGILREIKSITLFKLENKNERLIQNCEKYIQTLYKFWSDRVVNLHFPFHYIICSDGRILRTNNLTHDYGIDFLNYKDSINILSLQELNMLKANTTFLNLLSALELDQSKINFRKIKAKYDEKFFVKDFDITEIDPTTVDSFSKWTIPAYNTLSGIKIKSINAIRNDNHIEVTMNLENNKLFSLLTSVEKNNLFVKPISNANQSPYYLDETSWATFKLAYLSRDETLAPQESRNFIFKTKNVTSGTQKFVIVNLSAQSYLGTEFEINFTDLSVKFSSNSDISTPVSVEKIRVVSPFGYLNLRSQPNTSSQVIGRIFTGAEYEILENSGLWYKIQSESNTGWVLKSDNNYNYIDLFR